MIIWLIILYFIFNMATRNLITRNFSWAEMNTTNQPYDNTIPETVKPAIQNLMNNQLQPFRDFIGLPIIINSVYRSELVNKAVGGQINSQHKIGEAADWYVLGMSLKNAFQKFIDSGVPYDQLIFEDRNGSTWIHSSLKLNGRNRFQALFLQYDEEEGKMISRPLQNLT